MKKLAPMTLAEWRKDTGHTQSALAKKLGISLPYISQYENEKARPSKVIKEKFGALFPGYDVIEMRLDGAVAEPTEEIVEEIIEATEEVLPEEPERVKPQEEALEPMVETRIVQTKFVQPVSELFVLARGDHALAFRTREEASEALTEEILKDEETYGWKIIKAVMR